MRSFIEVFNDEKSSDLVKLVPLMGKPNKKVFHSSATLHCRRVLPSFAIDTRDDGEGFIFCFAVLTSRDGIPSHWQRSNVLPLSKFFSSGQCTALHVL